jgi:hypothetical protein
MNSYRVCWSVDVDASSAVEAARKALEIQRDPNSSATCFEVYGGDCPIEGFDIDLDDYADQDC